MTAHVPPVRLGSAKQTLPARLGLALKAKALTTAPVPPVWSDDAKQTLPVRLGLATKSKALKTAPVPPVRLGSAKQALPVRLGLALKAKASKTAPVPPVWLDAAKQTLPVRLGLATKPKASTPKMPAPVGPGSRRGGLEDKAQGGSGADDCICPRQNGRKRRCSIQESLGFILKGRCVEEEPKSSPTISTMPINRPRAKPRGVLSLGQRRPLLTLRPKPQRRPKTRSCGGARRKAGEGEVWKPGSRLDRYRMTDCPGVAQTVFRYFKPGDGAGLFFAFLLFN